MLELEILTPARRYSLTCEALLFDMDGTLIDSQACIEQVWRDWGTRHGLDIGELLRVSHGRRNDETVRIMAPHLDLADELAYLTEAGENCRDGITAIQGARRLLSRLDPEHWAVVTSAWRRLAEIRLDCAGLEIPEVLVTADDIERGKPDPDGYLRAAARLGVAPAGCVVVEDAPAGIAAARAAGMRVIGVTTTVERERLECDWCVDDLAALTVEAC